MTIIRIGSHDVQIDIAEELSDYNFGYNARWTADKLIASSPFREDRRASFFVNLTGELAGTWADSGAHDYDHARGNFVKLIALFRGITYDEAGDYLLGKYGALYDVKPGEPIRLKSPSIANSVWYNYDISNPLKQATSPYLLSRGITDEVQREYGIGYNDKHFGFTAIPWYYCGKLANIKYRKTSGKYFFYAEDGAPVKRLVFGIDLAEESAVLVEGEIDAMSWRVAGVSAIAVAGSHTSREQADIIKRSKIRRLYLGGDNDEQGRKLNRQAERLFRGYFELYEMDYGEEKDANDVLRCQGVQKMVEHIEKARPIKAIRLSV